MTDEKAPNNPTALLPAPTRSGGKKISDWWARLLALLALLVGGAALAVVRIEHLYLPPMVSRSDLTAVQTAIGALQKENAALARVMAQQQAAQASITPGDDRVPIDSAALAALRLEVDKIREGTGDQTQFSQLKNELAVVQAALAAMHGQVQAMTDAARQSIRAEGNARAQMIAFLQLRGAAMTAAPFAEEVKALGAVTRMIPEMSGILSGLERQAQAGVATLPMLQGRFAVMAEPAEQVLRQAAAKNWWDRLLASLRAMISIRKIDGENADYSTQALHDAAAALRRGLIAAAVAQVEGLPENARNMLQEWLADARARVALDAALARIGVLLSRPLPPTVEAPSP